MAKNNSSVKVSAKPTKISGHAFPAIVFILLGLVFLLNNFGLLPWSVWSFLWRFWPLFLILAGLQMIFGRTWLANSIIFALGFGVLSALILLSLTNFNTRLENWVSFNLPWLNQIRQRLPISQGELKQETLIVREIAFTEIDKLDINLNLGAGRFTIVEGGTPHIMEVKAKYLENFGKPILIYEQDGTTAKINLKSDQDIGLIGGSEETNYEIRIGNKDLSTNISASLGAGSVDAQFDNTILNNLNFKVGAGRLTLKIGEKSLPDGNMAFDVGAGRLILYFSYNSFIKINYDIGIGNLTVDGTSLRRSGSYTTPNFLVITDPKVIDIKLGAGSINIETSGN